MQRLRVNGGEIAYDVDGEGEPLLLIHGGLVTDSFRPLMKEPALAPYRRILVHQRIYASTTPQQPATVADDAADCLALLDALGLERAHVAGHSYGGSVALAMALNSPKRVASLVLMEPTLGIPDYQDMDPEQAIEEHEKFLKARGGPSPDGSQFLDFFFQNAFGFDRAGLEALIPGAPAQAERDLGKFAANIGRALALWRFYAPEAARIAQPTLYFAGAETAQPQNRDSAERYCAWRPDTELCTVDGAGHGMLTQRPAFVAETIAGFLKRHPM